MVVPIHRPDDAWFHTLAAVGDLRGHPTTDHLGAQASQAGTARAAADTMRLKYVHRPAGC